MFNLPKLILLKSPLSIANSHKSIRGNSSQIRGYSCSNIFSNLSKSCLISLLFLFSLFFSAQAKVPPLTLDLPQPWRTEIIKKEIKDYKTHYNIYADYKSQLSQKEIFDFYNDIFSSQGMKVNHSFRELKDNYVKTFIFKLGLIKTVALSMFTSSVDERFNLYFLAVIENRDILSLSALKFEPPRPQSFMPAYLNARQFGYTEKHKNFFCSLIPADTKDVVEFYLKEMPKRKWNLISRKDYAGKYNLFVALTMGHPRIPALEEEIKMKMEELAPGVDVNIEGSNLVFEKGKEKCIMTIAKLLETPQTLREMRIDPGPFEKYGRVLLSAACREQ